MVGEKEQSILRTVRGINGRRVRNTYRGHETRWVDSKKKVHCSIHGSGVEESFQGRVSLQRSRCSVH